MVLMKRVTNQAPNQIQNQVVDGEWVSFPGGELEGKRPKALCPPCRTALRTMAMSKAHPRRVRHVRRTLCFQCYRAEIDRERALEAAGDLDTASVERFQSALPFEPVNRPRLEMLKAERATARTAAHQAVARFEACRRQAQIAARHALQRIGAGLVVRQVTPADREREMAAAIHAAELQLPESWLPFVVSR